MRKKIMFVFIFTTVILLITPIVTSIKKPMIEKNIIDIQKLEDITSKNIPKISDMDYINTIMSNIKNKIRLRHPFICLFLLQIFLPNYIYFMFWNSIGITPYIPAYIGYITYTIARDNCDCRWPAWFE